MSTSVTDTQSFLVLNKPNTCRQCPPAERPTGRIDLRLLSAFEWPLWSSCALAEYWGLHPVRPAVKHRNMYLYGELVTGTNIKHTACVPDIKLTMLKMFRITARLNAPQSTYHTRHRLYMHMFALNERKYDSNCAPCRTSRCPAPWRTVSAHVASACASSLHTNSQLHTSWHETFLWVYDN